MKCVRCRREEAVVTIPYNGDRLGSACFAEFFERRVRKSIRSGGMLRFDDTVAVAVSGGLSSCVLAYLLKCFSSGKHRSRVFALTVEGGDERRSEAAAGLCEMLSVEHHLIAPGRGDMKALLIKKAEKLGASKLALGINLDDEAGKALAGFLDGTLKESYGSVRETAVPVITPLRECPLEEIESYARIKGIPHVPAGKPKKGAGSAQPMLAKLEGDYPGARFQILTSADYVKKILSGR